MKKTIKTTKVIPTPTAPAAAAKTAAKNKIVPKKITPVAAAIASVRRPAAPTATTITALLDVGFGNTLFLRGDGPGLSWDKGLALDCVDDTTWSVTLKGGGKPFACKFLVNDLTWSVGENTIVAPGAILTVTPVF